MKSYNKIVDIKTKKQFDIIDLTDEIKSFIEKNKLENGIMNIQTLHTTATVFVQENEPLLLEDIKAFLERIIPQSVSYNHDNFEIRTVNMCDDECANGHSHCKAFYLPASITLNILSGKLQLGKWQRVLFIELDRPRNRKVQIHIMGE